MTSLDFRNTNSLWCSVLVETLVRCGVTQAVVSPGSRSTPLTMALARHPGVEAVPVLDERSAGFFALGVAKQTARPVVLVCTSGTAGANYFPAVIEAHESGVPLIVITADRPPEMRDCASGQTIDQQKLFGGFVRFYHEFAVPEAKEPLLRYLRQTVAQAVGRARSGPVHLNAPFRDPLPPVEDGTARGLEGRIGEAFFAHLGAGESGVEERAVWRRPATGRGVIVAGTDAPQNVTYYVTKVREIAGALGWPVLADVLSPVRHGADFPVVAAYDAILRNEKLAHDLKPEVVLCLGGWPTSKVLRSWLEASGAEVVQVAAGRENRDALHGRTRRIAAPVETLMIDGGGVTDGGGEYAKAWLAAEAKASAGLRSGLAAEAAWVEPKVTATLAETLPPGTPLFVANSMPVRDLEYFWPANTRGARVYFSRGANGIDGTLSTALGVAHGNRRPAVLLTGDLALLHDANGFLLARQLRGGLTVVLINNDGGGIFNHLPVAQFEAEFEKYWATPQAVDFGKLCAAHGVEHTVVRDGAKLAEWVATLPESGVRVLEVRTERARDAAFRKRLLAEVAR